MPPPEPPVLLTDEAPPLGLLPPPDVVVVPPLPVTVDALVDPADPLVDVAVVEALVVPFDEDDTTVLVVLLPGVEVEVVPAVLPAVESVPELLVVSGAAGPEGASSAQEAESSASMSVVSERVILD